MTAEQDKIIEEIEEQRAMLQTYLASDMDIDKMDFNEVINYAIADVNDQNIFLGHWKDYAFLRGELKGIQSVKCVICNKNDNDLVCTKCRSCDTCEKIISSNNKHLLQSQKQKIIEEIKKMIKKNKSYAIANKQSYYGGISGEELLKIIGEKE